MSLNTELSNTKKAVAAKLPAHVQALMDADGERVAQLGLNDSSLKVGDKIPHFTLTNAVGKPVSSEALLKNGALVISFYRGAWCPYCNLELRALQKALPEIEAAGAQLVAISPNLPDNSLSSVEKHELTFEVLSDAGNAAARAFGLVFSLGEALRPIYQKAGFDITGQNGDDTWEMPVPATYIVDTSGEIVWAYVNVDYTRRAEPSDVVAALKRIGGG